MQAVLRTIVIIISLFSIEAFGLTRDWGTYYGGTGIDHISKVTTDQAGNVYVVGYTGSANNIIPPNKINLAFDPSLEAQYEAFVAKFNTQGVLQWATYYGDANTYGVAIAVDDFGGVYVTGSVNCPSQALATVGAHDISCDGASDMFLVKFNANGQRIWGTYLGGEGMDSANSIAVVTKTSVPGNVYLIGRTDSKQGIVSFGIPSEDATLAGTTDAVIARFNAYGKLQWARYFGGSQVDEGRDIACKNYIPNVGEGCYIIGRTQSTGLATNGAWDTTLSGTSDAFLAKLSGYTGKILWSTYYGGSSYDDGISVVIGANLHVYIGGDTYSTDAMATLNAFQTTLSGQDLNDSFLARFNPDGMRQWGTYFGAPNDDDLLDLAIDVNNNLYVAGRSMWNLNNELASPNAYDGTFNGDVDAVLAKFNSVGTRLWSTYYGGSPDKGTGSEGAAGIAIDAQNRVYVGGFSGAPNAIASPGAHQTQQSGDVYDGMLIKFTQ